MQMVLFKKEKIAAHNVIIHKFYIVLSVPNGLLTYIEQYGKKIIKKIEKEILLPKKIEK